MSRDRAVEEHPPNLESSLTRRGFGPRRDTFRAGKEHARTCYIRVNGTGGRFGSLRRVSRRLAVMAHYDHRGGVGPHVRRQVEQVAAAVDRLLVVSTADLTDESRRWLGQHAELAERPNYGYDFTSYKVGLHRAGDLDGYDEVVVCNDTYVPVLPYTDIFAAMAVEPVDFWGLTRTERIAPHMQSFFVAFRPWVVGSPPSAGSGPGSTRSRAAGR